MQAGRSVGFSRTGSHAAVASGDRLFIVDTQGQGATAIFEVGPAMDVAAVGNELWVAAGQPIALHRFARAAPVATPYPLWGHDGVLRPVVAGAPGALWSASPQAMVTVDRGAVPILGESDCIIPVSLSRWIVCTRDRVMLRDMTTERWTIAGAITSGRVVDGAVLFEGRTTALAVAPRGGPASQLVVVGLHDGAIHHRIALSGIDLLRFAAARGFALLRSGPRKIVILDLRFGRVLKEHTEDRDIIDMAIDDAGRSFLVRYGDSRDDVAIGSVRALLEAPGPTTMAVAVPATDPAPAVGEPTPAPVEAAPLVGEFHRGHAAIGAAAALSPRPEIVRTTAAQALEILERYRALVAAQVGRAIALAWDNGRLAFANEGAFPFHGEVTGILGRPGGRARDEIAAAEHRVAQATAAARAAEAFHGPARSPLAALASELGLSPLARTLLLLIAGPSLWGQLARLYGILGNDEGRPLVDEALLAQILSSEVSHYDVARELDRHAPLVRHGVVRCGDGRMRPFLPLTCEPVVLRLLQAADCTIDLDDIALAPSTCAFADLLIPAATKDAIVRAVHTAPGPGRIVVRGRNGAGRHTLLAALAAAANRTLGVIDAAAVMRDPRDRVERLRTALRRAHLLGMLPCVDGLAALRGDDQDARALAARVVDDHPGPVALHLPWDGQASIAPGYLQIDVPALSTAQRTACWRAMLANHALHVRDPEELAESYSVGPGVVARACAQVVAARGQARDDHGAPIDVAVDLQGAIRQHLETRLRATATRVHRLATWSRVVLPPDIQESVLELIARIKHRRTVYDAWGYDSVLTTARGVTALFQGGPGTGKTLVASAIANELGMELYRVDLSRVMSKWIGETEQNLAKLFDAAEDSHAIVLFDEADSLFAKRTEVRTSVDRYANLEVNYLLQRFDSFEGVAILTTNFGTAIDNAFKRRLSFRLTFPFPDEDAREALWKSHIPPGVPRGGEFDLAELARRYRLSGGYIRNAALRAAFLAAEERSPLTQDHLERAIKAEFREIGKIAEGGLLE